MHINNQQPEFTYTYFGNRRIGTIKCAHGIIKTPAFINCATYGALKGCRIDNHTGDIILVNALHCYNIADKVEKLGGIHKFMSCDKAIIADSGGFQIFSLGTGSVSNEIKGIAQNHSKKYIQTYKDNIIVKDPKTGNKYSFGAEESIITQIKLGVDFVIAFDECTSALLDKNQVQASMEKSHKWELRSLNCFEQNKKPHQAIYGIVQGGIYKDLRDQSAQFVNQNNFFGAAIGGSLGKTKQSMYEIVQYTASKLVEHKPRHILGIGDLLSIRKLAGVAGDSFDCVDPTRRARHGSAIVTYHVSNNNYLNIRKNTMEYDTRPIDPTCQCIICKKYSRAYLYYLFKQETLVAMEAITIHNINIMQLYMLELRSAIQTNFDNFDLKWFGKPIDTICDSE